MHKDTTSDWIRIEVTCKDLQTVIQMAHAVGLNDYIQCYILPFCDEGYRCRFAFPPTEYKTYTQKFRGCTMIQDIKLVRYIHYYWRGMKRVRQERESFVV